MRVTVTCCVWSFSVVGCPLPPKPRRTDNELLTNHHSSRLPRPQSPVTVVDLRPDAHLARDRVDFRTDKNNLSGIRVPLAARLNNQTNRSPDRMVRGIL